MPFEFAFVPIGAGGAERAIVNDVNSPEHRAFAQEFTNTIKRMDLQDVVALTIVPRAGFDGETETIMEDKNTLHLSGEHRLASPDHPSDGKHNVRTSFFWPTEFDSTILAKAKGTGCKGWDACRATVPEAPLRELEEWSELEKLKELKALEELDDDMVVHCLRGCDPRDRWWAQTRER